jgi:uncharacterized membrane protein
MAIAAAGAHSVHPQPRSGLRLRAALPALLLALSVALRRHWNLESQALDMGYADQVTWNMLHGRWFRFTPFHGGVGAELGRPLQYGPGADRDSLFAYHVELIYVPLSLLYLIRAGPETLIALLTVVLAMGALPAYLLARRVLGSPWAALPFAVMFLLYPSIQAANLSDFHPVSLSGTLLLLALYLLLERRYRAFVVVAIVCVSLKEEIGLVVSMMGLYAALVQGQRRFGFAVAGLAFAWVALCFGVIIPHFAGGAPSLFAARYAETIRRARGFLAALPAGRLEWPVPEYALRYLRHLLASTGFLALLDPPLLALAGPAAAVNALSGSTWQHGGGAHYSSECVPAFIAAAVFGARWLARQISRWLRLPAATATMLVALAALGVAVVEARQESVLPPGRRFAWPAPNGRLERLRPLLARIPPDAVVSAQSNVYPQLSNRPQIYVFPVIEDASYVLVDVAGTSDPLYPDELFPEVNVLLADRRFTLLEALDGFLLFERRQQAGGLDASPAALPAQFFSFAHPTVEQRPLGAQSPVARFGDLFEVLGYRVEPVPEVNFVLRRVTPTLHIRAVGRASAVYRVTTFRLGADNLARIHDDGNPTQLWRPTYQWETGEVFRLRYPPLTYAPGERLGVGVQRGIETAAVRLPITGTRVPVADDGLVAVLGPLP